jgi:hypothetical protein
MGGTALSWSAVRKDPARRCSYQRVGVLYPVLMKDPAKPNGMSPDEWMHTGELLNTLETLDHWLWSETKEEAELTEQHLISTQEKIAKASEYIAKQNAAYFQNEPSCPIEIQTAFQTDREWSKILEAGTKAAFPQLDFLQLSKIGGVFDLRGNVESLLLLEYLRHVCKSRRHFQAAEDTGRQELSPKELTAGKDIYDVSIVGLSADSLSAAITSAAEGLKTLLTEHSDRV